MFDPLMELKQMVKGSDKWTQIVSGCYSYLSRFFKYSARHVNEDIWEHRKKHVSKAFADK